MDKEKESKPVEMTLGGYLHKDGVTQQHFITVTELYGPRGATCEKPIVNGEGIPDALGFDNGAHGQPHKIVLMNEVGNFF